MKRWKFAMLALAFLLVPTLAQAQEPHSPMDPAAMEQMWQEFAKLGPEHELFRSYEGTWTTVTKDFMANPSQPTVSEGKATFQLAMDGRFLMQQFKGSFQDKAFEGMGISGYDNARKKYVGSWIDNLGTGIMNSEGTYDPATKTLHETMSMATPMGEMQMRMTTKHTSDQEMVFTMYLQLPDGDEVKSMEITYTKTKVW